MGGVAYSGFALWNFFLPNIFIPPLVESVVEEPMDGVAGVELL